MLINGKPAAYRNDYSGAAKQLKDEKNSLGGQIVARQPAGLFKPDAKKYPSESRARDAHLGLRFWIQLGQIEIAGFRECSGLSIETETFEYAEGGLNTYTHKLPVRVRYENIKLKRGLDMSRDLFDWYWRASSGQIARQPISIIVYDSLGEVVQKWDLQNAYPCKWDGPDLNAEHGEIAVESVEIAHEGLLPSTGVEGKRRVVTPGGGANKNAEKAKKRSFY